MSFVLLATSILVLLEFRKNVKKPLSPQKFFSGIKKCSWEDATS